MKSIIASEVLISSRYRAIRVIGVGCGLQCWPSNKLSIATNPVSNVDVVKDLGILVDESLV